MKAGDLERAVRGAIEEFNGYRSPEAEARLLGVREGRIKAEFRGSFCATCGFYDYFEDFSMILRDRGSRTT